MHDRNVARIQEEHEEGLEAYCGDGDRPTKDDEQLEIVLGMLTFLVDDDDDDEGSSKAERSRKDDSADDIPEHREGNEPPAGNESGDDHPNEDHSTSDNRPFVMVSANKGDSSFEEIPADVNSSVEEVSAVSKPDSPAPSPPLRPRVSLSIL